MAGRKLIMRGNALEVITRPTNSSPVFSTKIDAEETALAQATPPGTLLNRVGFIFEVYGGSQQLFGHAVTKVYNAANAEVFNRPMHPSMPLTPGGGCVMVSDDAGAFGAEQMESNQAGNPQFYTGNFTLANPTPANYSTGRIVIEISGNISGAIISGYIFSSTYGGANKPNIPCLSGIIQGNGNLVLTLPFEVVAVA